MCIRDSTKIKPGCIIEKIDGTNIKSGEDYYPLLSGKAGKQVLLSVYDPATKERFEEQVKPITYGTQSDLLYKRWVEQKRQMVDKLSNGKIGYVHVKGMNSESFRDTYSELLGRCREKEAVIVDTRHNGGGWLHEDLAILLSGELYAKFTPRGQFIGNDPFNRWLKPSCVLMCEDNYSNAHGFPWTYKTLKDVYKRQLYIRRADFANTASNGNTINHIQRIIACRDRTFTTDHHVRSRAWRPVGVRNDNPRNTSLQGFRCRRGRNS